MEQENYQSGGCSPSALRRLAPTSETLWSHAGVCIAMPQAVSPPSQQLHQVEARVSPYSKARTSLRLWAGLRQLRGFLHTKYKHKTSWKNTGLKDYQYAALYEERFKKKFSEEN